MNLQTFMLLGDGAAATSVVALQPLTPSGPIFRLQNGEAWRWKGVSSFREPQRFADGKDLTPFARAYAGCNLKRAWLYAIPAAVGPAAWDLSDRFDVIRDYLTECTRTGWRVELTLLTSARPDAQRLIDRAFDELADFWPTLFIEWMNEPDVYDKHTDGLRAPATTKILWTSGDYVNPSKMRGRYGVDHSPRDPQWMRKGGHNAKEFYEGEGPSAKTDPPHRFPIIEDEPMRPDEAGFNARAYLAYFATCGQMAGGATIHTKTGKFAELPTDEERPCIAAALQGLDAFPADTPLGAYRIFDEHEEDSLRTYIKGERTMVRVEPKTLTAPEPGWTPIEPSGVLWKR